MTRAVLWVLPILAITISACATTSPASPTAAATGASVSSGDRSTSLSTPQSSVSSPTTRLSSPTARQAVAKATAAAPGSGAILTPYAGDDFALTIREAYAKAEAKAKASDKDYALYSALGCVNPLIRDGRTERTEYILDGKCPEWYFEFQRPQTNVTYHRLGVWVAKNGVTNTKEEQNVTGFGMDRRGRVEDWLIDSEKVVEIVEKDAGAAYRREHPTLDVANPNAKSYALVIVELQLHPVTVSLDKQIKDFRGSKNVAWEVVYGTDHLRYVVDGTTGEILDKQVGKVTVE